VDFDVGRQKRFVALALKSESGGFFMPIFDIDGKPRQKMCVDRVHIGKRNGEERRLLRLKLRPVGTENAVFQFYNSDTSET
jgi:hypothetical protein